MDNFRYINTKHIIPAILLIAITVLFGMLFYFEMRMWDRVVIPFLITNFLAIGIFYILNKAFKDKFVSKIFIISILLHFTFILFWQLLKYYGIGLQMPTENIFEGYVSDVDGAEYHALGVEVNKYWSWWVLRKKMYGGLFPKIIGTVYHFTGISNPFFISCINSIFAGFIAPIVYYIGKVTLKDNSIAKLYSLFFVVTFAHLMNTSTLIRDVYITLFMYLSIFISYQYYKTRNILFLITTLMSLYCLNLFRPYACYIVFISIIVAFVIHNIKIVRHDSSIRVNKVTMSLIVLSPVLLILLFFIIRKLTHAFGVITSAEDLINVRDAAYSGSNTDYAFDFAEIYSIFPPLAIFLGMCCMFFAPFPWEWIMPRRMIYISDMLMLYCFLPSFFKNVKLIFKEKNYILTIFLSTLIMQFSIYCITLGNSGSIHRLRGPFLPMIYLIAMYKPDRFLKKILDQIQKWRII